MRSNVSVAGLPFCLKEYKENVHNNTLLYCLPPYHYCAVIFDDTDNKIYYEIVVIVSNSCSKTILPSAINNSGL